MLNNRFFIIAVIIIGLLVGVIGGVIFAMRDDGTDPEDTTPSIGETSSTPSESEITVIEPFEGNTILSEERKALLDTSILADIERLKTGVPKEDENGYYLTDENGIIIYEANYAVDYTDMEKNLAVIINHFADMGYSDEAVLQIQRYYYHFAKNFEEYETKELFEKIALCFPKEGTNPDDLTVSAEEVFGQNRDDGFHFVFEPLEPIADITVIFCDVKAWGNTELSDENEKLCIYEAWLSDAETNGTLEGWLHKIVNEMRDFGYGEKEIVVGQLLYAGSLCEIEYRYDFMECIRACIPSDREITIEELAVNVQNTFDVSIEDNVALMDYLEGVTAYEKGASA